MPPRRTTKRPALHPIDQPFFKRREVVLALQELPGTPDAVDTVVNTKRTEKTVQFSLKKEAKKKLSGDFELHVRFFEVSSQKVHFDRNPPDYDVVVDDRKVHTGRSHPFHPAKFVSQPVHVPASALKSENKHKITVQWRECRETYAFVIHLVERIALNDIKRKIVSDPKRRLPATQTTHRIREMLLSDDGITVDSLTLSLLCPYSKATIKTPVRGRSCDHLQCFDLENFLIMNEGRPSWKCPVCNVQTLPEWFVIDGYTCDVLAQVRSLTPRVTGLEFEADGSYKFIVEEPDETEAEVGRPPVSEEDFITLDSDDEKGESADTGAGNVTDTAERDHSGIGDLFVNDSLLMDNVTRACEPAQMRMESSAPQPPEEIVATDALSDESLRLSRKRPSPADGEDNDIQIIELFTGTDSRPSIQAPTPQHTFPSQSATPPPPKKMGVNDPIPVVTLDSDGEEDSTQQGYAVTEPLCRIQFYEKRRATIYRHKKTKDELFMDLL
ncbi:hypothetical protein L596_015615 [Steinernema carpocapsae]|uniref:SP-RING-type domain-containing protein n=1 Tax=Steinernema carpocapsae TaxID=34508 RepID=A0A4U5NFI9_STECR|nr:hypothetical protein L596_015615 [Steinernema carpocapsae]